MEENKRCNINQKTCPMDNCHFLKTLQDKYDEEFCKIVGEYERSTEPLKNRINECRKKSKVRLALLEQWRQERLKKPTSRKILKKKQVARAIFYQSF